MKFKILIISLIMFFSINANAQRKIKKMDSEKQEQEDKIKDYEKKPWEEKIKYGGGVSALFGSGYSFFYLQPWVGYTVSERFMPGIGATYIYQSQTFSTQKGNVTSSDNAYGLNIFCKAQLYGPLSFYTEYSPINFNAYNYFTSNRIWENQLFIGAGLYEEHSYLTVVYNLLWKYPSKQSEYYPFRPSPIDFRVGFIF